MLNQKSTPNSQPKEVLLCRNWIEQTNAIPHFSKVIKNVKMSEGIEITMNCNCHAFEWIVEVAKI